MSKVIVIVGFGPGISTAVAETFGAEGFSVALVARNEVRLVAGVEALKAKGIAAAAFTADAADPASITEALDKARAEFGAITVLHWNAFGGGEAPDLLTADPAAVEGLFRVAVVGLLAAVQAALPNLRSTKEGAVLVTNGAFGQVTPMMDQIAIALNSMGVALANAAKHKLVGLLAERLRADGVYVGEVMVAGAVKGTPYDSRRGAGPIDPSRIAGKFWELYLGRGENRAVVG